MALSGSTCNLSSDGKTSQLGDPRNSFSYCPPLDRRNDVFDARVGLKPDFGELGRHGSIIHPQLGPLFRMGSVVTSIPLETDKPVDAGIAAFCDTCRPAVSIAHS